MKNWKSTLGGALAALGTFLFGAPVVMNATSPDFPKPIMVWCMLAGFLMQGVGIFFGHMFSADAKDLKEVAAQVQVNKEQIQAEKKQSDTRFLRQEAKNDSVGAKD